MSSKEIKYFLVNKVLSIPICLFIYLYISTLKIEVVNEDEWRKLFDQGKKIIFCAWHQQFLPLIKHFGQYGERYAPAIMISQSRDGDIVANIAKFFHWPVKRGSSSKGGREALAKLIDHINENGVAAHILDGPRGPLGIVKPGIVILAQETNALVVPIFVESSNAWTFRSWDKMFLPKPFSKVKIIFSRPMEMSKSQDREVFERQRKNLEEYMSPHIRA